MFDHAAPEYFLSAVGNQSSRAEVYRAKADEIRSVSERMVSTDARTLMLGVADDYLKIADTLDGLDFQNTIRLRDSKQ